TTDGDGSHGSTSKTPSYTKSVSWHHYLTVGETLRTWTVMETLISIMGLLGVLAINAVLH
ncbi:hypothetical protein, partial [Escherichia coli]